MELASDIDRDFLLDGILNGFSLFPKDTILHSAEMHNYHSVTNALAKPKVEATILDEISAGNYGILPTRPTIISALGSVPKPNSDELRLIHDCSMPHKKGVNSYIDIDKLQYQTLQDATKQIKKDYFLAKVDLRHAYRSVPVHPSNFPALGLKWRFSGDSHYTYLFDRRLPFGAKSSPGIFHRLTQSIRRMMLKRGFVVVVYLDDFLIIAESELQCQQGFDTLCELLLCLGFQLSPSKLVRPTQKLVFLGIEIDTRKLSLALPLDKLDDLKALIASYIPKSRASKRELQALAGKLNWASRVIFGGRTFLRRILDLMNTMSRPSSRCLLTAEFKADIQWWHEFLDSFNGRCDFLDPNPVLDVYTDACNEGLGAYYLGDWLYLNFSVDISTLANLAMPYKEALAIIFAASKWCNSWRNRHIVVHTDNQAAAAMINKGTTRNSVMMSFLRLLFWLSATYNFRITAKYIPGKENTIADCISRLHSPSSFLTFFNWLVTLSSFSQVCSTPFYGHLSPSSYLFLCRKWWNIGSCSRFEQ